MVLDSHVDAHRSTSVCRSGGEPGTDLITRVGLPRAPALARELASVGIESNAVARAIEDLQRSGYRPLHAPLAAPEPSSILRARVARDATCARRIRSHRGSDIPAEEDAT
jgi:hypothetical protein